jgi:3-dehydroquinate synthase
MSNRNVRIVKDIKPALQEFLAARKYDALFVLADANTHSVCYPLIKKVPPIRTAKVITVLAGDMHKNSQQLQKIWRELSGKGASRRSLLINLGGGMVSDLGGFAAATFKRGIGTVNIPTTLMAAVDAAVGGKTGINFNGLKNEIGAFYSPEAVLIDCNFLRTLDRGNLLSGYAEMIKHALIGGKETYTSVLSFDLDRMDWERLNTMVAESVAIKERIVAKDPKERGIRKALNFGHTVGHAFESLSFRQTRPLLHGYAVAAGMVCELYLSYKQCGFPSEMLTQVARYIKEYYTPFVYTCAMYDSLYELMAHDKKNKNGVINFTLLSDVGEVRINQSASKGQVFEALDFYRENMGM